MKNRMSIGQLGVVATFATVVVGALAPACASAQELSDDWKFRGSIFLWMPTLSGTAMVSGNNTTDFEVNFSKILNTLKMGAMGNIEAQKGRWGAFGNIIYLHLEGATATTRNQAIDGVPVPATINLNTDVDLKGVISTFGGSYRLLAEPGSSFDLVAGARYLWLDATLNYDLAVDFGPLAGPRRTGSRSASGTTWDGIVGVKGRQAFGDNREWFVPYYADVGTGQSKLTYQAWLGLGYSFPWGEVIASWRYLDWKEPGDTLDKLTVNGPQLGVAFSW
jgi:hypothetical protein